MGTMRLFFTALLIALVPAALEAGSSHPETVETLSQRLARIDGLLRSGEWSRAEEAARGELDQSRRSLSGSVLGVVLARLAIAEAGLGRSEEATWHWQVAQSLDQGVLPEDRLRSFGAPGELLSHHPLRPAGRAPAGLAVHNPGGAVLPPRKITGELPLLSPPLRSLSVPLWLRAQVIIDAEGRPGHPVIVSASLPGMAFEVLEALRGWRFEPARKDGQPVAAFYQLTLNPLAEKPLGELTPLTDPALAEVDRLLREGRWKEANKKARKVWLAGLAQPLDWSAMGVLMSLRALAEAGLGSREEAICHWQAAQHLEPKLYHADLAAYGAAGELLEAHRWGVAVTDGNSAGAGKPPQPVKTPSPTLPFPVADLHAKFELAGIIDSGGHVRQPVLIAARQESRNSDVHPPGRITMHSELLHRIQMAPVARMAAISALESVCSWRFEPARIGGEPRMAASLWTVSVDRFHADVISRDLQQGREQKILDPRSPPGTDRAVYGAPP